ncbi:MAG TPA: tyrosine-type recombinase/integrase [Chloroflexota bacterium]|nr:tyrosine-type recombinase/integrase [Chloroflexota bacterium]
MTKRANGEGTRITRHANGQWWCRVTLPNGKRKPFYGRTQREVIEKRDHYLADYRAGRISTDAAQPVGKYLRDWLHGHKSIKPRTRLDYERQIELAAPIHNVRLDQLKPAHVQTLYDELEERGLGPVSVHKVHRVLRIAFRRAAKLGYILRSPTDLAEPPRIEPGEHVTLSAEQGRGFLESTRGDRFHALWTLALLQGLRSGELRGLRWSDVDLDAGRVTIRQTVSDLGKAGLAPGTPKTPKSRRALALSAAAVEALRAHRTRQLAQRLAAATWEDRPEWADLVFTTCTGGPLCCTALHKPLQRALSAAGLPPMTPHELRHSYATILAEHGCDLIHVQHQLGHSSYHLTADTYTHARQGRKSIATETVDRLFPVDSETG